MNIEFYKTGIKISDAEYSSYTRVIAIGDIHGFLNSLKYHLATLTPTQNDLFIFLGDYIDRGPDSVGTIEFLIEFKKQFNCYFIRGNHDSMFMSYLGIGGIYGDSFFNPVNGGKKTLNQYKEYNYKKFGNTNNLKIPKEHEDFFNNTIAFVETRDAFYSHAGFNCNRWSIPYDNQDEEDYIWTREEFIPLSHKKLLDKLVVIGHTITKPYFRPLYDEKNKKILLDSGCYYSKILSALCIYPNTDLEKAKFIITNLEKTEIEFTRIKTYEIDGLNV